MVRLEEGSRERPSGGRVGSLCANECLGELEQKEKEISRTLMIAEKDKRDAMQSLEHIRRLNDQLQALVHDFHIKIDIDDIPFDFVLPPSTHADNLERRRHSIHSTNPHPIYTLHNLPPAHNSNENESPNNSTNNIASNTSVNSNLNLSISPHRLNTPIATATTPTSTSTLTSTSTSTSSQQQQESHSEQMRLKEDELRRVVARAQQESAKAAFLRRKKDDLQQRLQNEVHSRKNHIKEIRQTIEHKEKEISRLSFLAEQDKKTGMFLCQQIAQLKKSLEGFLQAREEAKPENLCKILARCASSSSLYTPPTSPTSQAGFATPGRATTSTMRTAIGRDTEAAMREDEKKTLELARVKCIVECESKRVESLKSKVEELKQGLVAELQEADEQLGIKMHEFVQKQLAIEKVTARADRERARSFFLKEEILKLTAALGAGNQTTKKKGKTSEYAPDVAYLSEFSELCDLDTLSESAAKTDNELSASTGDQTLSSSSSSVQLPASLPLSISTNFRNRDPTMYIFSPPCRAIPISPASESIYAQKLKDIAVLNRETSKKDEELVRLKKLAEAERCRHLLLKDKFEQLRVEMREREGGIRTL